MRLPHFRSFAYLLLFAVTLLACSESQAQKNTFVTIPTEPTHGDELLAAYFDTQTRRLTARSLANVETADDWNRQKDVLRRQL